MTFAANFTDMMPDTLTVQPGHLDAYGAFVPSGAALSPNCRIRGQVRTVRNAQGKEVVSSYQALVDGVYNLTTDQHRYTLPARFSPRSNLEAVAVQQVSDEDGPCYEVVMLP